MLKMLQLKSIVAVILAFALTFFSVLPSSAKMFRDTSGYWAENSIRRLASLDIVKGVNDRFYPNAGVTRAEFATMIISALGLSDQAEVVKGYPTGFKDVDANHWASGFVTVAKETGIILGYPDNTFRPSSLIHRDEITSVLVKALNISIHNQLGDVTEAFKDGSEIPKWASQAVESAYNYKLISGFPDGNFYPKHNATRGETSALIEKVLQQLGTEYTFFGKLESIDVASKLLTININGQIESFSYQQELEVIIHGKNSTINNLSLGKDVFVILDDQGYIKLVELKDQNLLNLSSSLNYEQSVALNYNKPLVSGNGNEPNISSIIVAREGKLEDVVNLINSRGGKVTYINREVNFLFASVTEMMFQELKSNPLIEEITKDGKVKVNSLTTGIDESAGSLSDTNLGESLNVTRAAIKAPEFVKIANADGKNQIVAIIDTGIDAGHPDLQQTSGNQPKIVEWRDFTHEGDIDTSSVIQPSEEKINLANGQYSIGGIKSASGYFKYGYMREVDMVNNNGNNGYDLNFNGNANDVFGVIVVDSKISEMYDTVYVDTNGNKKFSDEKPMHVYSDGHQYTSFTGSQGQDQLNLVLTEISARGTKINLGFDGNDHGTHVAGIVGANGKIKGVAPGAQLMALKVLDAAGYGKFSTISEGISYAASHGAKIVNLSLGFPASDNDGGSVPAKLLNNLTEKYGVIFVVAAGNDGPGMSTVDAPDNAVAALSVGGFNSPEMWKTDYGWKVPDENIWFFSSVGPRKDGGLAPSIVAPGSVVSTVPLRGGKRYFLSEGTSVAAPHVAGAVALLMEVVERNNLKTSPVIVKKAVESGARLIPGYTHAEEGYGALNVIQAWAELLALKECNKVSVETFNSEIGRTGGVLFRDGFPKTVTLFLKNESDKIRSLSLTGNSWVTPGQRSVTIPPLKTRAIDISFNSPEQKGLFSSFIEGDDPLTYGKDLDVLATIVNPYILNEDNKYNISISDVERPAQYKSFFYRVPPGADSIKAELTVPNGRAKIFLFDPKGHLAAESKTFAGVNSDGAALSVEVTGETPSAGVWECVVYSSASLSAYNMNSTEFSLAVHLEGSEIGAREPMARNVVVGIVPKVLHAGMRDYVTIQVRERYTQKPYEGFLEINGEIYYTHRGKVTIPTDVDGSSFDVVVKTVPQSGFYKPWEFNYTLSSK